MAVRVAQKLTRKKVAPPAFQIFYLNKTRGIDGAINPAPTIQREIDMNAVPHPPLLGTDGVDCLCHEILHSYVPRSPFRSQGSD